MFTVGNNDSYYDLGPDSTFLSHNAGVYYTQFLNGTVDQQTFLSTFQQGGYYSAEPAYMNLTVIGLNTVIFFPPSLGGGSASAVAAELAWLDSTLASAQVRRRKVWLLMHVPPGANTTRDCRCR